MSRLSYRSRVRIASIAALAGAFLLPACGSSGAAPAKRRDLVVAKPVSVSPTLPQRTASTQPKPRAQTQTPSNTRQQPARRPGALVKAPRPGDDLSKAPDASTRASSEPSTRAESTIKVASASDTNKSERQPEAAPKPAPKPDPAPKSANWWASTPDEIPGRIRIVASGVGENLREARQAAVESGLAELRSRLGADPEGVTYERTTVQPAGSGRLRGYVLVSCAKP